LPTTWLLTLYRYSSKRARGEAAQISRSLFESYLVRDKGVVVRSETAGSKKLEAY